MINYNKYLTPTERAQCLLFGALMKCAEHNVSPKQFGRLVKSADVLDAPTAAMKTIAGIALITGIPIGIAAHVVGQHVNRERQKERELKEQIKYYRNTVGGLESGLTGQESQNQM